MVSQGNPAEEWGYLHASEHVTEFGSAEASREKEKVRLDKQSEKKKAGKKKK